MFNFTSFLVLKTCNVCSFLMWNPHPNSDHVPDSIPEGSIPDNGKCPDGFDLYFDYGLADPEPICLPIGTYDGDYATIPPANDEFDDNEIPE